MDASLLESLLPPEIKLRIDHVALEGNDIVVEAETRSGSAPCPRCRRRSTTLHSRYRRQLHDHPCRGRPLRLTLSAGKFICSNAGCRQRIFCERLSGLAKLRARTSIDLAESHRSIGLALGGEAGARLAALLSVPTSPDTILRRVKATPTEPSPPPRYVGIDDWACRKGQTYGTILVDLERRTVIDLLPGRDGEALRKWLAANPQVEVVTRDRWSAYIEAISAAAPQAKQVADRFHLIRNVREAAEKMLTRYSAAIRDASTAVDAESSEAAPAENATADSAPTARKRSGSEHRREEKHRRREERFQCVKELTAQGLSCRVIARRLGVNVKVVLRYRGLEQCPAWGAGRTGPSQLDDHAEFITEWIATGNRNTADLFRVLKNNQGYRGSYDSVRRYLKRRIGSAGRPGRRDPDALPPRRQPPSARKLSFRLVKSKPESRSARVLKRMRELDTSLNAGLVQFEELLAMLRRESRVTLQEWATKAAASNHVELKNVAKSLLQDAEAITAAMTQAWSNGQVEGQVGRLKLIKRQMFGRSGMTLLKARVLHKG
jgi:transposase